MPFSKTRDPLRRACGSIISLVLILASCLGLLAALDAGALVVLLLPQVAQDAGLGAAALEALESCIQRLILLDMDFRHSISLPPDAPVALFKGHTYSSMASTDDIIPGYGPLVNN